MKGVRKAFASKGDDATFSRFVKMKPGEIGDDGEVYQPGERRPPRHQWRLPTLANPKVEAGHTLFGKTVKAVGEVKNLLVSGHSNVKIGRDVRKGKFKGYWIYTLSLEERRTCPRTCEHWQTCYGNNMPWAKRIDHTDPTFIPTLEAEIERLLNMRGRVGVMVRLHALGDFYSVEYVEFWRRMLERHDRLAIFGYTARIGCSIGREIAKNKLRFGKRFAMRFSNDAASDMWATRTFVDQPPSDAIACPEQQGKVDGCGKCALCWTTARNIAFEAH